MRVSEDRYSRDLRRINLARRLIRHEARTHTIRAWTGLSDDRVRNLYRSYGVGEGAALRHRGPIPTRIVSVMRSPALRSEASAIAGLACVLGLVPPKATPNARRTLPSLSTGERLCHTFELFRQIVPQSHLSLEQLILLVTALAERLDLEMGHCTSCHAALLVDRLGTGRRLCLWCKQQAKIEASSGSDAAAAPDAPSPHEAETDSETAGGYQQSLF